MAMITRSTFQTSYSLSFNPHCDLQSRHSMKSDLKISGDTLRITYYTNIKYLIKAELKPILQHYNLYRKKQSG